jgi:hypothetical protein
VYALVEATKNGLYKSDDGGQSWTLMNSNPEFVSTRPFYFQEIACDPENENRLWLIYQMISKSDDAGKNFEVVIPTTVFTQTTTLSGFIPPTPTSSSMETMVVSASRAIKERPGYSMRSCQWDNSTTSTSTMKCPTT